MKGGKPVLVCAALALAAHAALLIGPPRSGRQAAAGGPAIAARHVIEPVEAPTSEPSPTTAEAPPEDALNAQPAPEPTMAKADAAPPDPEPPAFDDTAAPRIGFPDAQLPDEGVQLRAYVELEADGSPRLVSTASPPGATVPPQAFQKLTEHGLRQARFKPGLASAYCLLIRFEPDAPAPRLAWLPGAARDAARCLAGAMPPPHEIDTAAAP